MMIGDGMGFEYIKAARMWKGGELAMDTMPARGRVTTAAADGAVTDSAAATTALATGHKTLNGYISVAPDGSRLPTIMELLSARGYSSGLVSNDRITRATLACFTAHVADRLKENEIGQQYLASDVDIFLGGGRSLLSALIPESAKGEVTRINTRDELMALEACRATGMVVGLFAEDYMTWERARDPAVEPSLAEMTEKALQLLEARGVPFFLVVEGSRIDYAGHENNPGHTIAETIAFDQAVGVALTWAADHPQTLIVVTADHETGGMKVSDGPEGLVLQFSTTDHTGVPVPVSATGPQAELFQGVFDNTHIPKLIAEVIGLEGFHALSSSSYAFQGVSDASR